MAITFNITEALENMEFNALNLPIKLSMSVLSEEFEKNSKITSVFAMHTMDGYQDSMYDDTEMTMFKPTADLEVPGLDDFQNGYSKSWTTHIWTSAFQISKQAIEDGTHGTTTQQKVTKFTRTYYRTREEFAAAALAGALTGRFTFTVGDKSAVFDTTGNDGIDATIAGKKRPFFSQFHSTPVVANKETSKTYKVPAGTMNPTAYEAVDKLTGAGSDDYKKSVSTFDKIADGQIMATKPQSNKYSLSAKLDIFQESYTKAEGANLSEATGLIGQLSSTQIFAKILDVVNFNTFKNHRGYRGEREPIEGKKTIIVPSFPLWASFIKRAIAEGQLSESYDILEWSYLNDQVGFTEADQSLIILDKALNATDKGLMFLDRIGLTVENHIDPKTKAYIWDGRARFGCGNARFYTAAYLNCGKANLNAALYNNMGNPMTVSEAPTDVAIYDSTVIFTDNFATSWTRI